MPRVKLNVELLEMTQDALSVIYAAARQCYASEFAADIFSKQKEEPARQVAFVRNLVKAGHESPLEHAKFTFAIEGVSRALTHQLVRHRIASFSQQSQRYVKEENFDFIIPPSIESDEFLKSEFLKIMDRIQKSYNMLLKMLKQKSVVGQKANEDARFVLPQAAETKIVVTMNCRELLHFFKLRCGKTAQWEIRNLADAMLKICKEQLPAVFSKEGASCYF